MEGESTWWREKHIVEGGAHGGWKYYLGLSLRDSEEVFIG